MILNIFEIKFTLITAIIGCIVLSIFIIYDDHIYPSLKKLITNKIWLINTILILLFYSYINLSDIRLLDENVKNRKNIKEASNKALIAFIIAIFASIDITVVPFWFVFSFAYFTDLI